MAALILSGETKICKRCGEVRPIESFPFLSGPKSNRRIKCRICRGLKTEVPKFRPATPEELKPNVSPTLLDIAWASGIYEGEGSCSPVYTKSGPAFRVSVCQKDPEILIRLHKLFGGSVRTTVKYPSEISTWYAYGARAHGFALTVFSFLSARRRLQIKKALEDSHRLK